MGEHVRLPRTYRGRDIQYWMGAIGRLDERYDDIAKARKVASPQLVGSRQRRTLDLNELAAEGVEIRGRLGVVRDGVALFSGGLANHCTLPVFDSAGACATTEALSIRPAFTSWVR